MADTNAKETATETEETTGVRIKPDLTKYVNGVSGSGKKTKRCDDDVARALDGFTLEEVLAVASRMTETSKKDLNAKYEHLNIGMQRMNLGNRIRGAVAKLDKMHDADSKVVAGVPTLLLETANGRAAVGKRVDAKVKADKIKDDKAAAKALAEEKKGPKTAAA